MPVSMHNACNQFYMCTIRVIYAHSVRGTNFYETRLNNIHVMEGEGVTYIKLVRIIS